MAIRNVKMSKEGKSTLVIKCDMSGAGKPSGSGKTSVIASTGGNVEVDLDGAPDGLKLGLNLYVPAE